MDSLRIDLAEFSALNLALGAADWDRADSSGSLFPLSPGNRTSPSVSPSPRWTWSAVESTRAMTTMHRYTPGG